MKASELIKKLEDHIKSHGDLPIKLCYKYDNLIYDELKTIGYMDGRYSNEPNKKQLILTNLEAFEFWDEIDK